jgi:O-succinylbenzoic acid--CoA ligase
MKAESPFHKNFKFQGKLFNSKEELIDYSKNISPEVASFLKVWYNDKLYIEVKTSGSTGKPKLIKLQKKHMINSAKATGGFFQLPKKTTALLCMSPKFIAGKMILVRAMVLGWEIDVVEPVSNPLKNIKKNYDFSAMVPLQLNNSINEIHKIKKLIVGGGVVSKELLSKIQNVDTEIFATYGMTETITHIAVKKLNNFESVIASSDEKSKNDKASVNPLLHNDVITKEMKQSHYQTLPNISISKDKRGCLVITAPNVSEKKVITNDVVELISSIEFKWLGRFDSVINSGGIKLISEQIEEKLSKIFNVRFFVIGIEDMALGEKLILIVEGNVKNGLLNKVQQCKSLLKYEIPKEIYFVSKFIETPTQKINRKETLKLIKSTC